MGYCRFMYDNLLSTPEQITLSSARPGLVGMPAPRTAGGAVAYATGLYSGQMDQVFLLEIDSLAAGSQVGQATFRWRRADASSWEASGVPTSFQVVSLDLGVGVKWVSGPGQDFFLGDSWSLLAVRPHGAAALLDRDRDTEWRSIGTAEEYLNMDLGQASQVAALILADHNLSPTANATLQADADGSFAPPAWSQALDTGQPHLAAFPGQTYRYWRIKLEDPDNGQAWLRASQLYLGPYFQPSRTFSAAYVRSTLAGRRVTATDAGKLSGQTKSLAQGFQLSFKGLGPDDAQAFRTMYAGVHQVAGGRLCPLFFTPDSSQPGDTIYCLPTANLDLRQTFQDRYQLQLDLEEVVRTNV